MICPWAVIVMNSQTLLRLRPPNMTSCRVAFFVVSERGRFASGSPLIQKTLVRSSMVQSVVDSGKKPTEDEQEDDCSPNVATPCTPDHHFAHAN